VAFLCSIKQKDHFFQKGKGFSGRYMWPEVHVSVLIKPHHHSLDLVNTLLKIEISPGILIDYISGT
jgi:hypothetical protein